MKRTQGSARIAPTSESPPGPLFTTRQSVLAGCRDMLPVIIGYIPFALALGAALTSTRVDPFIAWCSSWLMLAGAAQIAAVQLLDAGAGAFVVIATGLIINARLLLYSADLARHTADWPTPWRWIAPYFLTDPAYALANNRFNRPDNGGGSNARLTYFITVGVVFWTAWQLFTGAGALLGRCPAQRSAASSGRTLDVFCACSHRCSPIGPATSPPARPGRSRCSAPACPQASAYSPAPLLGCSPAPRSEPTVLSVLVLIAIALGTYAFRAAFVVANRKSPPAPLSNALPLVGPAVLAAMTVPALLAPGGEIVPETSLPALAAALVCYLLRRLTNSLPIALLGGLGVGWIAMRAIAALS